VPGVAAALLVIVALVSRKLLGAGAPEAAAGSPH
jgi:hypothetical protein